MSDFVTDLVRFGGGAILAFALLQAAVLAYASWRRTLFEDAQRETALALLRQRVDAAVARTRAEQERAAAHWAGFRKFRVTRRVEEAEDIVSFHLAPTDARPLPGYLPGQYLTLQARPEGKGRPVIRCYSLSDRPGTGEYRITVKRLRPPTPGLPPGQVSSHLVGNCREGEILDIKAPSGRFTLDPDDDSPVVLIAGGIGVTPLLAMVNAVAASGVEREIWLFWGVRNRAGHPMREHLAALAADLPGLRMLVAYSDPEADTVPGRDYDLRGHVTIDLIRETLPSSNYTFYVCGPSPMMRDLPAALRAWGVPPERIRIEAFGPASVKAAAAGAAATEEGSAHSVEFARSGRLGTWTAAVPTLLDLAEQQGVRIEFGCRAGHCGTCTTVVRRGEVAYLDEPAAVAEQGSCLVCVAVPKTDLVLDA